ncbi:MAG: hypothetical protein K2N36_05535, partial [Ruminiclostridium sp.]|nr:hypothetical protein [Ruminiclostridium sp.]
MKAIHIISTAPYFAKHKDSKFTMDKFELYSAALSALSWRSFGDEIDLITDSEGEKYIRDLGIADVWNS